MKENKIVNVNDTRSKYNNTKLASNRELQKLNNKNSLGECKNKICRIQL